MKTDSVVLSRDEFALMVGLAADANPDKYNSDLVKAAIYRARAIKERALTEGAINVEFSR